MSAYAWSVSGNGAITGPADQQPLSVLAGPACGTTLYSHPGHDQQRLQQHLLARFMVNDAIRPVLSAPADRTLECPADTRPDATGIATAQDACGSVSVSHSDEVIDQCGDSMTIKRTWTATDACNNVSSALQTIIVRDITPPVLSAPADRTLECPADTQPDATGVATAQDTCGSVSVSHSDEVIDQCGDSMTIKRTWTATDACNNVSSALQTIIVRDITPPVLSAPADRHPRVPRRHAARCHRRRHRPGHLRLGLRQPLRRSH